MSATASRSENPTRRNTERVSALSVALPAPGASAAGRRPSGGTASPSTRPARHATRGPPNASSAMAPASVMASPYEMPWAPTMGRSNPMAAREREGPRLSARGGGEGEGEVGDLRGAISSFSTRPSLVPRSGSAPAPAAGAVCRARSRRCRWPGRRCRCSARQGAAGVVPWPPAGGRQLPACQPSPRASRAWASWPGRAAAAAAPQRQEAGRSQLGCEAQSQTRLWPQPQPPRQRPPAPAEGPPPDPRPAEGRGRPRRQRRPPRQRGERAGRIRWPAGQGRRAAAASPWLPATWRAGAGGSLAGPIRDVQGAPRGKRGEVRPKQAGPQGVCF